MECLEKYLIHKKIPIYHYHYRNGEGWIIFKFEDDVEYGGLHKSFYPNYPLIDGFNNTYIGDFTKEEVLTKIREMYNLDVKVRPRRFI